jgi:hypothetical protein
LKYQLLSFRSEQCEHEAGNEAGVKEDLLLVQDYANDHEREASEEMVQVDFSVASFPVQSGFQVVSDDPDPEEAEAERDPAGPINYGKNLVHLYRMQSLSVLKPCRQPFT